MPLDGPFYRRPSQSLLQPSFTKHVVGKNMLSGLVKQFCSEAGYEGHYTGHSGKVTCATESFKNNNDEQLIQLQTCHRSTSSVGYTRSLMMSISNRYQIFCSHQQRKVQ
jgi:hypothetical protein